MTDRITLAPDDAAKVLGIGASTLQDWTRRGIVPSIKIGGVRLYSLRALEPSPVSGRCRRACST